MGLGQGTWVGLMLGNVPDFVILALALSKLKATIVPLDPTTGSRELELITTAAPLRALITRPRGSDATSGQDGEETPQEAPEIRRRLQGTLLTCSVFKRDDIDLGVEPVCVMFTADSLGDPKGVLRTQENLEAGTQALLSALDIDVESRILVAVPLYHAYGWDLGLLSALRTGATMFLEEEISAMRVAKLLRDHTIDVLPGTPTMYGELAKLPMAKPLTVDNPRYLSAGSRLDPEIAAAVAETYGVKIMSCYHTTETGVISIDKVAKNPESVGKCIDGMELQFTPLPGKKATSSKRGAIWVRGESLSPQSVGPFKDIDMPVKADGPAIGEFDDEGWLRTGDVGKLDRASRLHLTGREDDLVKIEGKRVALGEVEGCIETFPSVRAAQVRLVSDPFAGAMVVAKVVIGDEGAAEDIAAEDIIDHCARNLAPYKVPRRIEFCERL